jgi:hypothetical protein
MLFPCDVLASIRLSARLHVWNHSFNDLARMQPQRFQLHLALSLGRVFLLIAGRCLVAVLARLISSGLRQYWPQYSENSKEQEISDHATPAAATDLLP